MRTYEILAHWDAEARVWWAESDDVAGLVAEADSLEGLVDDLRALVPELLALNANVHHERVPFRVLADRQEEVCAA